MFTSDLPWDPSVLDLEATDLDNGEHVPLIESTDDIPTLYKDVSFDESDEWHNYVMSCIYSSKTTNPGGIGPRSILPSQSDYSALHPFFGWLPAAWIKDTLKVTTQWYKAEGRLPWGA